MDCIYCGSELIDCGVYGYLAAHQSGEVLGRTYKCPNHEGFPSIEEAINYLKITEKRHEYRTLEEIDWETICSDSCTHSVSGYFYTDKRDNLHEGYPC